MLGNGLARRDDRQKLSEVVAIIKFRESTRHGTSTQAVEGADRNIFLVSRPPGSHRRVSFRRVARVAQNTLPRGADRRLVAIGQTA